MRALYGAPAYLFTVNGKSPSFKGEFYPVQSLIPPQKRAEVYRNF